MPLDTWGGAAASDTCNNAWLWRVMQKEKNKDMIAMLEDNLQTFVQDATQTLLYFPPRNAFHRRVCYAVARRYGLDHRLEEHRDPDRPHAGVGETVRLVLIKTPHSATPPARLAEFAAGPPPVEKISSLPNSSDLPISCSATNKGAGNTAKEKAASAPKPATFLRRPRSADGKTGRMPIAASSNTAAGGPAALRSISEEDYQKYVSIHLRVARQRL